MLRIQFSRIPLVAMPPLLAMNEFQGKQCRLLFQVCPFFRFSADLALRRIEGEDNSTMVSFSLNGAGCHPCRQRCRCPTKRSDCQSILVAWFAGYGMTGPQRTLSHCLHWNRENERWNMLEYIDRRPTCCIQNLYEVALLIATGISLHQCMSDGVLNKIDPKFRQNCSVASMVC